MKKFASIKKTPICLLAIALTAAGAATTAIAAAPPPLQGAIVLRPVTPGDKSVYALPSSTEVSGGLSTVAVGTPIYLEADVNIAVPASDIVSVTWVLTNKPTGSLAVLTNSPLGTNVPVYEPSARQLSLVASRKLLRPDVTGQYTVVATITTGSSGTTNVSTTITVGTYMGVNTCALCHSGGSIAPSKVPSWATTAHSMIFSNGITGNIIENGAPYYSQSCLACHTVGYDTTASSTNDGGFYSVMLQTGWTFPTNLVLANWAAMPAVLQNVANIQCENCHGPGSEHALAALRYPLTNSISNWPRISPTVASGDCNQCHDAPTHHIKGTEWYVSRHALTTGPTSGYCLGCHSANGFIARMDGDTYTNTAFAPLTCQTCHEPHGQTSPTNNPHLLRNLSSVTMPDGTVVTNAGFGAVCLQCHQVRNGSVTVQLANYPLGLPTWVGGSSFGSHDNPQGDMIEGINAVTYGQTIPSSAHRISLTNTCVDCHMQTVAAGDPAFLHAGGHTFGMSYNVITNGVTNIVDKVDVCVQCHGPIKSFDFPVQDYNGDGVIEGVQTEVQHLLNTLSTLLPNSSGVVDGTVKTKLSIKTNWPAQYLKAAYNWQFVNNDGSKGVHNAPFATGLLKASIADLTGNPDSSGTLSASDLAYYEWQIQYFGSASSPNAAPNATPAGDGVPNWLKYSLGINPLVSGSTNDFGGIVWASGTSLGGNNSTNTVQIYTAAEVTFDTQVDVTYQLQAVSSLSGGWQNVGAPIPGTGTAISYVTPTRKNVQQFFRVVHSP